MWMPADNIESIPFLALIRWAYSVLQPAIFAAQLMKRDRSTLGNAPVQGQNNIQAVEGYDAYFGSYTLDATAGTLAICLDGSTSPSNSGGTFVRNVRVAGDELIIQLAATAADGTAVTLTLVFSRLEIVVVNGKRLVQKTYG
jgi:hypothetical protein